MSGVVEKAFEDWKSKQYFELCGRTFYLCFQSGFDAAKADAGALVGELGVALKAEPRPNHNLACNKFRDEWHCDESHKQRIVLWENRQKLADKAQAFMEGKA